MESDVLPEWRENVSEDADGPVPLETDVDSGVALTDISTSSAAGRPASGARLQNLPRSLPSLRLSIVIERQRCHRERQRLRMNAVHQIPPSCFSLLHRRPSP
ncbi:hypothetical protein ACOMHN_027556 [Nucella lapillus]